MTEVKEGLYREIILDHYRTPRNKRRGVDGAVVVQHENPLCGDEISVAVEVTGGAVVDAAFDGKGCAIAQASASMMTEAVRGRTVDEAHGLLGTMRSVFDGGHADEDLGDLIALEGIARFPVRVNCASLAWKALEDVLGRADPVRAGR